MIRNILSAVAPRALRGGILATTALLFVSAAVAQQYGCAGWPIARSQLQGSNPRIGSTFYINDSYEYNYTCSYNRLWAYLIDISGITAPQLFPLSAPACHPPCYIVNPDGVYFGILLSLPIPNQPVLRGFSFRVQRTCVTSSCIGFYGGPATFTVL